MKLIDQNEDQVDLRISVAEFVLLTTALDEICHGFQLTDRDFQEIVGAHRNDAASLVRRMTQILERLGVLAEH
jgi:hypothetical protein